MPDFRNPGLLRQALAQRDIRFFLVASVVSNIGLWVQRVAVGWMVFDLTRSAGWVGAVAAQAQAFVLAAFAWYDMAGLATLTIAAVTLGLIDGINQPPRLMLASDVAPRPLLSTTVSLNSFGFNVARFIGPIVAGLALGTGSPALAFALNGLSFTPFILLMLRLNRSPAAHRAAAGPGDGIVGGLRHAAHHPVLGLALMLLLSVSLGVRGMVELLPAIAGKWFGPAPSDLASLTVSVGAGAMLGGVWLLRLGTLPKVLGAVLVGPGGLALGMLLFAAFGDTRWLAHLLLGCIGFMSLVCGSGTQSLIHLTANPAYRGRVLSLFGIIQRAGPAIGALILGLLADALGLAPAFVVGAVLAGLAWGWVWMRRQRLQKAIDAFAGSGDS